MTYLAGHGSGEVSAFGQVNVSDDIFERVRREAHKLSETTGRGDFALVERVKTSVVPQVTRDTAARGVLQGLGPQRQELGKPGIAIYISWWHRTSRALAGWKGRGEDEGRRTLGSTISKAVRYGSPLVAVWVAWNCSSLLTDARVRQHLVGLVNEVI
ncbi:hypothetical protein Purlil1_13374 [Purpureocillium lilacinum]|uniref:Uncharacterized protein n=1 Tax=Purpureocillium lilacinum TaxID=33203 RepID=A0ABR0BEA6_PURLI|nr:hypothetical protein Purlil1_13374 [Purpureocillium lilacinum]